jgi:hypothetical protein
VSVDLETKMKRKKLLVSHQWKTEKGENEKKKKWPLVTFWKLGPAALTQADRFIHCGTICLVALKSMPHALSLFSNIPKPMCPKTLCKNEK